MKRRQDDPPLLHHDRLGTIFHHLHQALVELERMIREERERETHKPPAQQLETPAEDGRLVYTIDEAAKLLNVGRYTAYAMAKRGELPTIRLGRLLKVPKTALHKLLDQRRDR